MLASFPVQKIFLSATIPPILEESFLEETSMPSSTPWIRASTTRPNLRYHVFNVDNYLKHVNLVTIGLAKYIQQTLFGNESRGIVFCGDIDTVEKLAMELGSAINHSKLEHSVRVHQQSVWFKGLAKWMVATTGFLHGIDNPHVDAVIFVGIPYGLINIEQGAGRAGRSGQPANIFLLKNPTSWYIGSDMPQEDPECRRLATLWAGNTTDCRRLQMSKIMDGTGKSCEELAGSLLCDVCQPDTEIIKVIQALMEPDPEPPATTNRDQAVVNLGQPVLAQLNPLLSAGQEMDAGEVQPINHPWSAKTCAESGEPQAVPDQTLGPAAHIQPHQTVTQAVPNQPTNLPSMPVQMDAALHRHLSSQKTAKSKLLNGMGHYLLGKCYICWAWKDQSVPKTQHHSFFRSCAGSEGFVDGAMDWLQLKKMIRFKPYEYCFMCGLPQEQYLLKCHPVFKKGQRIDCPLGDLVAVLDMYIFWDRQVYAEARKNFPGLPQSSTLQQFAQWINREGGPSNFYNGLELVLWFWKYKNSQ